MQRKQKYLGTLLLAGVLVLPLATVGCGDHHYYRVYDADHSDYHRWDDHERVYYNQWVIETHREPQRDFRKLDKDDQKAYWGWRHNHPDSDHDHDHR